MHEPSASFGQLRASSGEVLLFDLDGTLTDPREGITRCLRHALEAVGAVVPHEDELVRWIGPPLHHAFRQYLGDGAVVSRAVEAYRGRFAERGLFENQLYPGVPEALAQLRQSGWTLFLATSKPAVFARKILEHFGLAPHFAGVYGSELSGERSDKAELIAHLLAAEGVGSAAATMIGDRAYDVVGARRNGVRALGVLWGYGSLSELSDAGAEAVFASISELQAALCRGRALQRNAG